MVNYICFMNQDRTYTVKRVKKFPNVFQHNGKDYAIDPQLIYMREGLFTTKRYLFFQENRLTPLPDKPDDNKIQALITAIERDHTVAEFLHEQKQNLSLLMFVGIFGIVMGLAIGIIIAPHVLAGLK